MTTYEQRKARARERAIDWQAEAATRPMSYGELADALDYFTEQAKRYGLTEEFRENGII